MPMASSTQGARASPAPPRTTPAMSESAMAVWTLFLMLWNSPAPTMHGHHHVGADGEPHEQVHEHSRHRVHAADAREREAADELSGNGGIRRVQQLLEDAAQRQGNGEPQNLARQGAVEHIDAVVALIASISLRAGGRAV